MWDTFSACLHETFFFLKKEKTQYYSQIVDKSTEKHEQRHILWLKYLLHEKHLFFSVVAELLRNALK